MKLKLLITLLLCVGSLKAQNLRLNFDENIDYSAYVENDTFRNTKPWQIGTPNKIVFKPDNSYKRVLITDSVNPCKKNDTFSCILKFIREHKSDGQLSFKFNYNIQGGKKDIGTVEISPNQGLNWVDILKKDTMYNLYWGSNKPNLSGNSNGWKEFKCNLQGWDNPFINYPIKLARKDTILIRLTYITDTTTIDREGWMIDSFDISYLWSSINKIDNNTGGFNIYPQPSSDIIYFSNKKDSTIEGIEIYNSLGQKVLFNYSENITSLYTENLPSGLYSVRIKSNEQWYEQKLVVER